MITAWTKHLKTEDEKQAFANQFRNSVDVLERLNELLDEEIDNLDRSELTTKTYDSPSWAFLQAHKNGYRQAIQIVKKLISPDQRNSNE